MVFWVVRGELLLKKAKSDPKWQKILSHFVSQELHLIWLWFLVHICKMMVSSSNFFYFFKSLIFRVFQSSSINAKRKLWGVPHLPHMFVMFLLSYDLFCSNWSYQGQNYQNVPQIVSHWKTVTIPFVLFYQFFYITQPIQLGFLKSLSLS